jgi:hypothetical protein
MLSPFHWQVATIIRGLWPVVYMLHVRHYAVHGLWPEDKYYKASGLLVYVLCAQARGLEIILRRPEAGESSHKSGTAAFTPFLSSRRRRDLSWQTDERWE